MKIEENSSAQVNSTLFNVTLWDANFIQLLIKIKNVSDDCTKEDGTRCLNGVCLDSVCHCNDGFGGCNCQVPGIFINCNSLCDCDIV